MMEGIQFVINERGERTAVLIDLRRHAELWEDIYDKLITDERADEPRESLDVVRERLQKQGDLGS